VHELAGLESATNWSPPICRCRSKTAMPAWRSEPAA